MNEAARDIDTVVLSTEEIQSTVAGLAASISRDYAGRPPLLVSALKGAVYFLTDLTRAIDIPVEIDFIAITRYGSARPQSGVNTSSNIFSAKSPGQPPVP